MLTLTVTRTEAIHDGHRVQKLTITQPSGSVLEGSRATTPCVGIAVAGGHWRLVPVNVNEPEVAPSAAEPSKLGCDGLHRGGTDATRPGQKHVLTWSFGGGGRI